MHVVNYKATKSDVLKGIFSFKIDHWNNCTINECKHFVKDGSEWIHFPTIMYMDNGGKKYKPILIMDEPEANLLKAAVLEKLHEYLERNPDKKIHLDKLADYSGDGFWKE